MKTTDSTKHSFLFRAAATTLFVLMLCSTVASSYPLKSDFFSGLVRRIHGLVFEERKVSRPPLPDMRTFKHSKQPGYITTALDSDQDPSGNPKPPPR